MTNLSAACRLIALLLALWSWSGCTPISGVNEDEEKNPHFLAGKSRFNSMDYSGAIESYEKALEANPNSASAHLELGLLFEQKMNDYATAIYHYQKHLKLRPKSNMAESVRQRIGSCKVDLAKSVAFSLVNQQVHSQLAHLTAENSALRDEVQQLKNRLAQETSRMTNRPAPPVNSPPANHLSTTNRAAAFEERDVPAGTPPTQRRSGSSAKAHVVKRGETMASIAREHGIPLPKLQAANPSVEPRKLRVGQAINLPPSTP